MKSLQQFFYDNDDFKTIVSGIEEGLKEQLVAGLSGSARTVFTASLYRELNKSILIVTHNLFQAQKVYEDLLNLIKDDVYLYPVNDLIASEVAVASPELKAQRIEVLNQLSAGKNSIVVAPVAGIRRLLPPKSLWKQKQFILSLGQDIDLDEYIQQFISLGYERVDMVSSPGEFSVRGGIIDIYPLTEDHAIRIELFDTEIDSIRSFNIEDQRSIKMLKSVMIGPAVEMIVTDESRERCIQKVEEGLAKSLKKMKNEQQKEMLIENIQYDIERLRNNQLTQDMFKFSSLFYEPPASLLDYFPVDSMVILDEISRIHETYDQLEREEAEWFTGLLEEGRIFQDVKMSHSYVEVMSKSKQPSIYLSLFLRHVPHTSPQNILNLSCKQMQSFHGQMNVLKNELERWEKAHYSVAFLGVNEERTKKLQDVLEDYEIEAKILGEDEFLQAGKISIVEGDLQTGFELPMQKLAIITEEELFKKRVKKQVRRQKLSNAERIKSYSELEIGDYVVHVNHGIGKYLGIETLEINGIHKDYLNIRYQGSDQLYVPVDQIDQVQKYVGSEGKEPKIYKLGGND
ncbi:MAG TPA: CarD family transcriptional regulator, partial [Metabacillus sp.]|nr:CarD family transcriptional regulator [Metabacillus sp.]